MLEDRYLNSNQLCFFIHDVMVEFIKGGEENKIFISEFKLSEQEKESLNNFEGHILDWLKSNNKTYFFWLLVFIESVKSAYFFGPLFTPVAGKFNTIPSFNPSFKEYFGL